MYTYGKKHSKKQGTFALLTELGSGAIHVIDLEGKIHLKPEGQKSRAELLSQLSSFSLPREGTVSILRKRLAPHLHP